MKGFIKVLFTIIASILLFISTLGFVIRITFLDKNYILTILDNNNFYTTITNEIRTTVKKELRNNNDMKMISYLIDNMVDFAIQEEPIKKEINLVIDQLYNNEKIKISGEFFSEDYTKRIKEFLSDANINIPGTYLEKSLNVVFDKSIEKMDLEQYTDKISYYFNIINNYLNIGVLVSFLLSLIIIVLLISLSKKKKIVLVLLTMIYGLLLLITAITANIIIANIDLSQLGQFKGLVINVKDSIVTKLFSISSISIVISLILIAIRRSKKDNKVKNNG